MPRRSILLGLCIALCPGFVLLAAALLAVGSPSLGWDFNDPELAAACTVFLAFEQFFVRLSPFALATALASAFLTRKRAK